MGLTKQSTGTGAFSEMLQVQSESPNDIVVALAGNPNTGKSTLFNSFTGLNQHTGNWPGKTVTNAQGRYIYKDENYILVDLPGTYSLLSNSVEEQVARDFICFGGPHVTVVVADATCLERNLNLVLQVLEITDKVVVCVNLLDEADKKTIHVNLKKLSAILGVPVVGTSATTGNGLEELKTEIRKVALGHISTDPIKITYGPVLENIIKDLEPVVGELTNNQINNKWAALHLIDEDNQLVKSVNSHLSMTKLNEELLHNKLKEARAELKAQNIDRKDLQDLIVSKLVKTAEAIGNEVVSVDNKN
ncbi:FeoB small GTPase domain-containing protein, partial [Aminipila sp.]|uniref:FeoB small GTPase domain-containing protein n=1 Tax=Aminipila sp. TaxID=2060095 RepID=UPI00289FB7F9